MVNVTSALAQAQAFCDAFELRVPILMAPMAGACPASLAIAVANAGGLGGCGALLMKPEAIRDWVADVRAKTNGNFQINLSDIALLLTIILLTEGGIAASQRISTHEGAKPICIAPP